ncbi:hypothetical protein [Burkholderia ubonensis]|uniref:hypothetical protein n=1 Tax=Burkholderia ubonensis TaxID=101571 RepID=UPI00138FB131|nr:hypothetical protein [Burkholderia ubonensis]
MTLALLTKRVVDAGSRARADGLSRRRPADGRVFRHCAHATPATGTLDGAAKHPQRVCRCTVRREAALVERGDEHFHRIDSVHGA